MKRLNYLRRIFKVYLTKDKGYLGFWHETPAISANIIKDSLGPYYQTFEDKANYQGPKDKDGVILFDYYFDIGRQYNPLAIAQYGLGHFNQKIIKSREHKTKESEEHFKIAQAQADWLVKNLEQNDRGIWVWKHKFPWHYKKWLPVGWYSAHSQGAGISLLARMYKETGKEIYLETAKKAFVSLNTIIEDGGVKYIDKKGNVWLEEYIIDPPTHVLNGFLWALWGVWDYYLLTRENSAMELWKSCIKTLKENLSCYDAGFWSLYDLSEQKMKMLASPFYHRLHIVQLKITYILSGEDIFKNYADKFENYEKSWWRRNLALIYKMIFKIFYF